MIDYAVLNEIVLYFIQWSQDISSHRAVITVSDIDVTIVMSQSEPVRLTAFTDRWRITMALFEQTIEAYRAGRIILSIIYLRGEAEMLEDLTAIRLGMVDHDEMLKARLASYR